MLLHFQRVSMSVMVYEPPTLACNLIRNHAVSGFIRSPAAFAGSNPYMGQLVEEPLEAWMDQIISTVLQLVSETKASRIVPRVYLLHLLNLSVPYIHE